tara:strand:- start:346 stop:606 length:261 start_codon:yes stop_codon:yes gene_type:complete
MNILDCLVEAPTKAEAEARPEIDKLWNLFDFFYETGEAQMFEAKSGNRITFSNNRKASAWNLIINFKIVLTSDDAEEIINAALTYA